MDKILYMGWLKKRRPLYPVVLLCVLCTAACTSSSDETPSTPSVAEKTPYANLPAGDSDRRLRVVFLGNSLSAGYGLDPTLAFPALIQQKVDSLGWPVTIINAGISGETSAGGLSRIDWLLNDPLDVLVLELGGNDGLRGFDTEVTKANLQGIITRTRARYPEAAIVLAGMQVPTNLGSAYTSAFRALFPVLARENDTELIPFLLEGVGGIKELTLADGIHPTAAGHRIIAETIWETLGPVLEARLGARHIIP